MNTDTSYKLGFENITGEFRVVLGFMSCKSVGDIFELTEIDY